MSKGSWTRVKDRERYERHKQRIYMTTHGLLILLGDRIRALGAPQEIVDGYRQALAMSSIWDPDGDTDKEIRSSIMKLHGELDKLEKKDD